MNELIARQGFRMARRHPRRALRLGMIAAPLLSRKVRNSEQGRRMVILVEPVRRASTDPKVHKEVRRAAADVSTALRRAQRVGAADALGDRRVARKLILAAAHTSRAARYSVSPPRHRARNATFVVLGTGALAGAAYGTWKVASRPPDSAGVRLAEDSGDAAPPDASAQPADPDQTTATDGGHDTEPG